MHGDNTDGVGICRDIIDNLGCPVAGKRVLVLGAGGAVRGVLGQLLSHQPASVVVANRTVDKAVELAHRFRSRGNTRGCGFDELAGMQVDIAINGTAASLNGEMPVLPELEFSGEGLAYDMVYSNQPHRIYGLGPVAVELAGYRMDWGCWSSRQRSHSSSGTAGGPRQGR